MTVSVTYKATPGMLGRREIRCVRLDRTLRIDGKANPPVEVTLAASDALDLVEAYREGKDGMFQDVLDSGRGILVEMVPWESFTMRWMARTVEDADDSLWSVWAGPFMDEIEKAAKEAME